MKIPPHPPLEKGGTQALPSLPKRGTSPFRKGGMEGDLMRIVFK